MARSRYLLLISLVAFGLPMSSTAQKAALDSVLHLLEKHPAKDIVRLDLLNEATKRLEFIHPVRGMPFGDEAIELARSLGDQRRLVVAIYRKAALDQSAGRTIIDGRDLTEAIGIARRLGFKHELAWALLRKGLGDFNQYGPDTNRIELTEAARIFHTLGDDEGEGAALNLQAGDVRNTDPARARELYKQAERLLKEGGHTEWLVWSLQNQSLWNWMENRFDEAIALGERALALCATTGFDVLIGNTHSLLGNANKEAGHYIPAVQHFLVSLRLYEALDLTENAAICCLNLGPLNEALHDTSQATIYLERGYELARKGATPALMTYALRGLGSIAEARNDFAKALHYSEEALALCPSAATIMGKAGVDQCEASANTAIGEAKKGLGDFLGAKAAYEAALTAAEHSNLGWEMAASRNHLSKILLKLPDSLLHETGFGSRRECDLRAVALATQALEPAREGGWAVIRKGALTSLTDGYERLNDPTTALRYAKELMVVKDSLLDADKSKAISDLQIQYDTEKKEQQIVLLGKDKEVQAKEIQKQKLVRNGFIGGFALVALFASVFFVQRNRISKARKRSDELLLNILPEEVAEELKDTGAAAAKHFDGATILFTDFKGFTQASERMSPQELVEELNTCFKAFDNIITARGIEKIKTIGDAYMCAGGLPDPKTSSPADVVHAALEMQAFMTSRKAERDAQGLPAFEMRVGIHTGPVVAGIVGVKKFQYDIWGDTVNTASRMESSGEVGQVNISEATYVLVKNARRVNSEWSLANGGNDHGTAHSPFTNSHSPAFAFIPRGKVQAKGKGEMEMFFVGRSLGEV